jgi:MFS family permease
LVGPADLVSANALNSIGDNVARLTAPALGGALLGWLGLASVVLVDSVSFLFSALMIFCVVVPAVETTTRPTAQPAGLSLWREWLAGLRVVRGDRVLNTIFLQFAIGMVGEGILDVLFVPFVKQRLEGDALTLAWLMSAQAVGSLMAGGMVSRLSKSFTPARLIAFGALGWGVFDAVIFNIPVFWLALAFFFVVGIPIVAMNVSVNALMQHRSADRYRGRIFGAYGAVGSLMLVLGMSASTLLGDQVGVLPLLNAACILMLLSGLVVWLRLPATA